MRKVKGVVLLQTCLRINWYGRCFAYESNIAGAVD